MWDINFNLISLFLLNLQNLEDDEEFQQALKTSHGQRPGVVSDISYCVSILSPRPLLILYKNWGF